jgi:hypothetical protein
MGFKNSLFKGVGFAGKALAGGFKSVATGMKTNTEINNNVRNIETDVKKYERVKPISALGVLGQVLTGAKVNKESGGVKAEITGREKWGYLYKKEPEKPKPAAPTNTSAFAKKSSYNRKEAAWMLADDLYKKENKELLDKLMRYNPRKSNESRLQYAERLNNEVLGGAKDPAYPQKAGSIGLVIGDQDDKNFKIPMRQKFLEKETRDAAAGYDFKGVEDGKIKQRLLKKYWEERN